MMCCLLSQLYTYIELCTKSTSELETPLFLGIAIQVSLLYTIEAFHCATVCWTNLIVESRETGFQ